MVSASENLISQSSYFPETLNPTTMDPVCWPDSSSCVAWCSVSGLSNFTVTMCGPQATSHTCWAMCCRDGPWETALNPCHLPLQSLLPPYHIVCTGSSVAPLPFSCLGSTTSSWPSPDPTSPRSNHRLFLAGSMLPLPAGCLLDSLAVSHQPSIVAIWLKIVAQLGKRKKSFGNVCVLML